MKHRRFGRAALLLLALLFVLLTGCGAAAASDASFKSAFSLIWFSDPQGYSEYNPEIFNAMTEWTANNAARLNAKAAVATGDFVNTMDDKKQWENAMRALSKLKGRIPLFPIAGNHDTLHDEAVYDTYISHLGKNAAKELAPSDGYYLDGRGVYKLLDVGGAKLILLGLGYSVSEEGIKWLNDTLDRFSERKAILCFHGYIDPDGSYTSDGLKLYNGVVTKHSNVFMVLCGHRHGVFHRSLLLDDPENREKTYVVHELVADYQDEEDDGAGYLCVLEFSADAKRVHVWTYSPYLDDYNLYPTSEAKEDFTLKSPN